MLKNKVAHESPSRASASAGAEKYKSRVYLLSCGFFFLFSAFNAAQSLATSLSAKQGHIDLAVLYGTFAVASIFAPKAINVLGPRVCMVVGGLPYIGMILSNLSTEYSVTVPLNCAVGLGAPLLWTGQGVYLSRCALYYGAQMGITKQSSTSLFNGIFFACFQLNGCIGLVLSSLLLTYASDASNILVIVLGACVLFGVFILSLLTDVPPLEALKHEREAFPVAEDAHSPAEKNYSMHEPREPVAEHSNVTLCQTLQLLSNPRMFLMVPVVLYNGLSLGFLFGDFTQEGSSQALGLDKTGFVMASFYLANAIATVIWSKIATNTSCGRKGIVLMASLFHLGFYAFFYVWNVPENFVIRDGTEVKLHDPSEQTYLIIFSAAVVFAIGDSVWESQVPAILQTSFNANGDLDAAMANLKLWQSVGLMIQFFVAIYIDFKLKVLLLAGFQVLGVLGLMVMHYCKVEDIDEPTTETDDFYDYHPADYNDDDEPLHY